MKVTKATPTSTPSRSKIQPQKRKEITTVQILLIIIACLLYLFIQNQEAILKSLAKQRATLYSDDSSSSQQNQHSSTSEENIFEVFYKQEEKQSTIKDHQGQKTSQPKPKQSDDIRPLFKQALENRIEKILSKKQAKVVPDVPPKTWTKVNMSDISMGSIQDIITKHKTKNILKGSQFYSGQMSFIVSLKASANFIQNSLFLEHTMIEQIGKGKQISKIIDNSFQYILKNTFGFDGISKFVNSQRTINKQIHGIAALKSASKTIRTQFTVDLIYTLVETTIDATRLVRGNITGRTFIKNVFVNLISTTGSTIGYTYGTIKFGNQLGGIMGSITGAFSSNFIAQVIYKEFFSDEPQITEEELIVIVKDIIYIESSNTDLNMNEIELLIQKVSTSPIIKIDSSFEEEDFKHKLTELVQLFIAQIIENRDKVIKA